MISPLNVNRATKSLYGVRAVRCLSEDIEDGFAVTVSGGVKRTLFNFEGGLRTDPHCSKDGGVKIHYGDRVLHSQQRTLLSCFAD